jgi:hypothetical protein
MYLPDFSTPDPAKVLGDELKLANLIGYLDGVPAPQTNWLGREVWEFPNVTFPRADILKIWKESNDQQESPKLR